MAECRIIKGPLSARPDSPTPGTVFIDLDTGKRYYFESTWREIPLSGDDPSLYVKKTDYATTSAAGIAKVGAGLSIDSDHKLNIVPATAGGLGGVKTGATVTIDENGFLDVAAAAADALGGVKLGAYVADATDATDVITQLNALLASLRTAGVISSTAPTTDATE